MLAHWRAVGFPQVRIAEQAGLRERVRGHCHYDNSQGRLAEVCYSRDTLTRASDEAVSGLIVHELAHCRIDVDEGWLQYEPNADRLCRRWGFGKELRALGRFHRRDA
jgi:hypothetical protein